MWGLSTPFLNIFPPCSDFSATGSGSTASLPGAFLICNLGLTTILKISIPILNAIYPVAILLILLGLSHGLWKGNALVYPLAAGATGCVSLVYALYEAGVPLGAVGNLFEHLPSLTRASAGSGRPCWPSRSVWQEMPCKSRKIMFDGLPGGAEKFRSARGIFCCILESSVLYFSNKLYVQLLSCSYNKERKLDTMEHPAERSPRLPGRRSGWCCWPCGANTSALRKSTASTPSATIPGITQTELAAALNTDKPAIARRTAQSGAEGLPAPGTQNPADSRSQLLYPTEQAQNLRNAKAASENAFYEYLLSGLDQGDREKFLELLDILYRRSKEESRSGFPM